MATIQQVNNGDSGLDARNKINQNFNSLNADKFGKDIFTAATDNLGLNPTDWDINSKSLAKAKLSASANVSLTLSNTINQGRYLLLVQKTVAGDVTVSITQSTKTTIYEKETANINLTGNNNQYYLVDVELFDTQIYVKATSVYGEGGGGAAIAAVYADITAMTADQANQEEGQVFEVTDASADATVDIGKAWYKIGPNKTAALGDYTKISEEEAFNENILSQVLLKSGTFSGSSGTETQNAATSNITGQTGTATFKFLDVNIDDTGRTASGGALFVDFRKQGVTKFSVDISGSVRAAGDITSIVSNSALIEMSAASSLTNPVFVPNRGNANYGLGGSPTEVSLIGNSISGLTVDSNGYVNIKNRLVLNGASQAYIEASDVNTIDIYTGGSRRWLFSGTNLIALNSSGAGLIGSTTSGTSPTLLPNRGNGNTGIGSAGFNQLDLIAGGTNIVNMTTTAFTHKTVAYKKSYTVATLPSAATAAGLIYVSDETGGATMAFSDGTNWRRVQDRAIVS